MTYKKLKELLQQLYGPALMLHVYLHPERREQIRRNLLFACIFLFILVVTGFGINKTYGDISFLHFLTSLSNRLYGLFLITFTTLFIFSCLEALHRSFYYRGLEEVLNENTDTQDHIPVVWEVATIVTETRDHDVTGGFIGSLDGQEVLFRLGITPQSYSRYENMRTTFLPQDGLIIERDKGVTLATYAKSIYKQDQSFRQFLSENNIGESELMRACDWVTRIDRRDARLARWWSRDNLGRIPGIAKTWGYGQTYLLERYGHDLTKDHIWHTALMTRKEEDDEVEEIEQILSRNRQSNVLLITDDILTGRQRVAQLYHKIREGHALPPIESKRVFLLDIEMIIMSNNSKQSFEVTLREIFVQAVDSGNAIVYIENISSVLSSAGALGVDVIDVLLPFLQSDTLQVILGETSEMYNKALARDIRIAQIFDTVQMKHIGEEGLLDLLEQRAYQLEKQHGIVFTIQALATTSTLAERYFPTGVMPDKAFDLLEELIPYAFANKISQVLQKDVEVFVNRKTNVPIGEPKKEEREKLLDLEHILHKRVVAQDEAITAISKALRRARAGLADQNKPLGSFLFLGPTGVGKTETAKALAEVLFSNEKDMIRLDMSEFNGVGALEELVGSFDTGKAGRLEELLREKVYGVLLLDEFEKAHTQIHDVFLQILDEGHFTDAFGHVVNMKNHIIIATSNAGAELVWNQKSTDITPENEKQLLIDYMITKNIFKPELLNRFDDIIVFHTLSQIQITKITRFHLENFAKKMEEEHKIKVKVTDALISYVSKHGYDPKFGGRPLERAIHNDVEQIIADSILAGKLHQGDTFEFDEKMLQ